MLNDISPLGRSLVPLGLDVISSLFSYYVNLCGRMTQCWALAGANHHMLFFVGYLFNIAVRIYHISVKLTMFCYDYNARYVLLVATLYL